MKRLVLPVILLWVLFTISCKTDKRVDQEKLKEEFKEREIKKVSEAEIYTAALQWGDTITSTSQNVLASNLKKAIQKGGAPHAIKFCNVRAIPLIDSLQRAYNINISRVSLNARNPADEPDSLERVILKAYQYNRDHDEPMKANVQEVDASTILYTRPISINNALCLSCHGAPGKEINDATLHKIDSLYPDDQARNHKFGDLRGMWSLYIPTKEIVKERL